MAYNVYHNTCFCGEIRKASILLNYKKRPNLSYGFFLCPRETVIVAFPYNYINYIYIFASELFGNREFEDKHCAFIAQFKYFIQ